MLHLQSSDDYGCIHLPVRAVLCVGIAAAVAFVTAAATSGKPSGETHKRAKIMDKKQTDEYLAGYMHGIEDATESSSGVLVICGAFAIMGAIVGAALSVFLW